jgi:hypothetical protein
MSQSSRDHTLQDAHEWDVMMTTGTLFPAITPQAKNLSAGADSHGREVVSGPGSDWA